MAAVKSDPPRPNVVVSPDAQLAIKPGRTVIF